MAGYLTPPTPPSYAIDPVTVTIGGVNAPVFFAGPTAGYTGFYQVNINVPRDKTSGARCNECIAIESRAHSAWKLLTPIKFLHATADHVHVRRKHYRRVTL